jgi:hypothetical protein
MPGKKFIDALLLSAVAIWLCSGCNNRPPIPQVPRSKTENAPRSSGGTVFHVPDTPIALRLPDNPSLDQQSVPTKLGSLDIRIYTAFDDLTNYTITVNDYPKGAVDSIAGNREKFLTHMADSAIEARPGSKLLSRRDVSFASWSGLEEKVEMPSGRTGALQPESPVIATRQYYQDGDRMYLFQVLALKSIHDSSPDKFDQDAAAFFESMEMVPREQAK